MLWYASDRLAMVCKWYTMVAMVCKQVVDWDAGTSEVTRATPKLLLAISLSGHCHLFLFLFHANLVPGTSTEVKS